MNDWIMFWHAGKAVVDVVLRYEKDDKYPLACYAVTPHYGRVDESWIIETRSATSAEAGHVE